MMSMMWITKNLGRVISGLFCGTMKKPAWTITCFAGGMYREVEQKIDEEEGYTQNLLKVYLIVIS